ncbi:MAG: ATP-dependent helicase HrpB [Thalassolituus sp.]|jgi:ATP-dependent helicase HrpB
MTFVSPNCLPSELPIDDVLDDIKDTLTQSSNLILIAAPGAGKTTRVPLALLNEAWLKGKKILMLEPRRVAARNAATFMASQLSEPCGQTVGYRMRRDSKVSKNTRIEVVTEGILTRLLQSDPELSDVGLIIFDEFHERHLASDLGLSLSLQCQQVFNPDLKLLVMSATLDSDTLSTLLNAPVIQSEGRSYPVETHYRPARDANEYLPRQMSRVISEAVRENPAGDILAFLPGVGEINRVQEQLGSTLDETIILPLHGQLSDKEQKQVLQPDPSNQRKIILATNIAESSLTIDGVSIVIDSGLEKRVTFRPNLGLSELATENISRASATQRQGRAGRQSPGQCYRLYSETSLQQRQDHIKAEILSTDLTSLLGDLLSWGASADELDWLTPPPQGHLNQAEDLLTILGILKNGQVTAHGQQCLDLGLDTRLANMIIRGRELGMEQAATELAALLQEPTLLRPFADIEQAVHVLKNKPVWKQRIQPQAKRWGSKNSETEYADLGLLLGCAFPDRIAKLRSNEQPQRYQLASGSGAELDQKAALIGTTWLACAEISGGQPNRIRQASKLSTDSLKQLITLHPNMSQRHVDIRWLESGQLLAEEQQRLGALVVKSQKIINLTDDDWLLAWHEQFEKHGLALLNWDDSAIGLRARLALAHQHQPNDWPDVSDDALLASLSEWLDPFLTGVRNTKALKKLNLNEALLSLLTWEQQQALNRLAPTHIKVASGSNVRIDYSQNPPVLAVKLQEMFGYEGQPSVMNGQLPLLIHLLSPARRPLQVTQDLPHFWRNSYADVRKDMRGRYPKHPWPEDPLSHEATRFTKKRQN